MKSLIALLSAFTISAHATEVPKVCVSLGVLAGVVTEMRLAGRTQPETFRALLLADRARIEGELDTAEDVSLFVEAVWRMNVKQPYTAVAVVTAVCTQERLQDQLQRF